MTKNHLEIFLFILLLNLSESLFAIDNRFTHLSELLNGSSTTYCVQRDSLGQVWVGTQDGIERYDGTNVKYYSLKGSGGGTILRVNRFKRNLSNVLFASTSFGLFFYDEDKDQFKPFNIWQNSQFNNNNAILDMAFTTNNNVWLATQKGIVHIFENKLHRLTQDYCSVILSDHQGKIFACNQKSLLIFDAKTGAQLPLPSYATGLTKINIQSLCLDKRDRLWIGTDNGILYVLDRKQKKLLHKNVGQTQVCLIRAIVPYKSNQMILGIDEEGLVIMDENLNISSRISHEVNNPQSLSSNSIFDLYVDKFNRIWCATNEGGINCFDPLKKKFYNVITDPRPDMGLLDNSVRAITEDKQHRIWFGTKDGISIWNRQNNTWKYILSGKDLEGNIAMSISNGRSGIWIGMYGGEIYEFANSHLKHINKTVKNDKIPFHPYPISQVNDTAVIIGAGQAPLDRLTMLNPLSNKITYYNCHDIYSFNVFNDSVLFVGTWDQFLKVNLISHKISPVVVDSLSNHVGVFSIARLDKNRYLLGTAGYGLKMFDEQTGNIKTWTIDDGLPSNIIYGICPINDEIWISTSRGLASYSAITKKWKKYTISDGLCCNEFNYGAFYETSDGFLIFGGVNGAVMFNPKDIKSNIEAPNIVLTNLSIFNKEVTVNSKNSPLKKQINFTQDLILRNSQNSFSFGFVGVNMTNPKGNTYQWILEDYDKDWTPRTSKHEAIYTRVAPGNYTLKIKAYNNDGVPSQHVKELNITILPPWWQTDYAYIGYSILLLLIIWLIIHFSKLEIQKRNFNDKLNFFIQVAHDIQTPLSIIRLKIHERKDSLKDSPLKPPENINNITIDRTIEQISGMVNQLIDYQKLKRGRLTIKLEAFDLVELIKLTIQSFSPLLNSKEQNIKIISDVENLSIQTDKIILERIINNLLSNAFKYTPKGGTITVRIQKQNNFCLLSIKDTGFGINSKERRKVFNRNFRSQKAIDSGESGHGIGLILVKELVQMIGSKITFKSKVGVGSTFILSIPLKSTLLQKQRRPIEKRSPENVNVSGKAIAFESNSTQSPTLLIVDDNEDFQMELKSLFVDNCKVLLASNGKEAYEIALQKSPDIIISDVMMPIMDGNEFCHTIKEHIETCHIPVILLTALNNKEQQLNSYSLKADAHIPKPFDPDVFIARVESILGNRKRLREKFIKYGLDAYKTYVNNPVEEDFIDRVSEVIKSNLNNTHFGVNQLSEQINMSRSVLFRKLKSVLDKSPQELIMYYRMQKAEELLLKGEHVIVEIADECGFQDPSYFSKCFKKFYGKTPSEYTRSK